MHSEQLYNFPEKLKESPVLSFSFYFLGSFEGHHPSDRGEKFAGNCVAFEYESVYSVINVNIEMTIS